MKIKRTEEKRFENLPDYSCSDQDLTINAPCAGDVRIHDVEEGDKDGPIKIRYS